MKRLTQLISIALVLMLLFSSMAFSAYAESFVPSNKSVIYFEVPAEWENYIKIYCHVWEFDGGDPFANWLSKKELCTETETTGVYSYNITEKTGKTLKEGITYCVIFADDTGNETFETLFSTDCFGDTLYCDGTNYYTPEYSRRISPAAFWKHQNPKINGPLKQINSIGNVIGTALPKGVTDEDLFVSFLTDSLDDARFFTGYPDQWILEDTLYSLDVTVDVAVETICNMSIYVDWEAYFLCGDADMNETVNIKDATYIQKAVASLVELNQIKSYAADIDSSANTTVKDATNIQKYIAGIRTDYPIGKELGYSLSTGALRIVPTMTMD